MEFNRNHYFMLGLVLLALGLQLRIVESYVLNEHATKVAAQVLKPTASQSPGFPPLVIGSVPQRHVVRPPKWVGAILLSVGGVLVLWSLAMQKPGG